MGAPLSEEVPWLGPGLPPERAYPVQFFQHALLKYRPVGGEPGSADDVRLSLVGDAYLRRRGLLGPPGSIGRVD